jgi:hypothetical protein
MLPHVVRVVAYLISVLRQCVRSVALTLYDLLLYGIEQFLPVASALHGHAVNTAKSTGARQGQHEQIYSIDSTDAARPSARDASELRPLNIDRIAN